MPHLLSLKHLRVLAVFGAVADDLVRAVADDLVQAVAEGLVRAVTEDLVQAVADLVQAVADDLVQAVADMVQAVAEDLVQAVADNLVQAVADERCCLSSVAPQVRRACSSSSSGGSSSYTTTAAPPSLTAPAHDVNSRSALTPRTPAPSPDNAELERAVTRCLCQSYGVGRPEQVRGGGGGGACVYGVGCPEQERGAEGRGHVCARGWARVYKYGGIWWGRHVCACMWGASRGGRHLCVHVCVRGSHSRYLGTP